MIGKGKTRAVLATGALLLSLGLTPLARGAEITRPEYSARVEPICKRNTEANRAIFAGAKQQVKSGQLKAASKHFGRAVSALNKTIRQLEAVPRPTADEARLEKWFSYLGTEGTYLGRIGKALGQEQKGKAQTLSVRLNRNSNLANNAVLPFGFSYCKLDPSRFA